MARKSNTTSTEMDKSSFFFTANCGICHPGGAAMQYDRNGKLYYDRSTDTYGYNDASALTPDAKLDGDYGFINPSTGVPTTANWAKTGVTEADCLMCHLNQYATGPGTANHNNGVSWHKRTASLRGFTQAGTGAAFEKAPSAGAGWATVTYIAGQAPPMASAVDINYDLGVTAGTLKAVDGNLVIPGAKVGSVKDANCRLCHAIPDGKKAGRTLLPTTDVHVAKNVGCTRCHVTPGTGTVDSKGVAEGNMHQIGKGDITIGSVRNDLDNTALSCTECHLEAADAAAPNPTAKHAEKVPDHLGFMSCQVCHIRHLDDDGSATPTQDIPEAFYDMVSTGKQTSYLMDRYFKSNPVDPTQDLPELVGKPFRYYPGIRDYKGKLTTVKPLYAAWFGEWLSGEGDSAAIRPIQLRLVRKAMTGSYAVGGAPRLATLPPVTPASNGVPVLWKKAEIKASLLALRDAEDTANPDTSNRDIASRPVLVMADKVYYLNAADEVEYFHSIVAESHDFAINHNTVAKRDPLNPVVNPGPYGAGGCTDCHSPNSAFFYGKQLASPAEYEYLDEHGTVPNPNGGKPAYSNRYEHMGYSDLRAGQLSLSIVPVTLSVSGANGSVSFTDADGATVECDQSDGSCRAGIAAGGTVTFTAVPGPDTPVNWQGCTPGTDPNTCTVKVGTPMDAWANLYDIQVKATFGPLAHAINASAGTGGTISPAGGLQVPAGQSQTFVIIPNAGYTISQLLVDGSPVTECDDEIGMCWIPTQYTFSNVNAPHTISVSFGRPYTITASTPGNGAVYPAGATTVIEGNSQAYTITPHSGYKVGSLVVDGVDMGAHGSWTFSNVVADHSLVVNFVPNTPTSGTLRLVWGSSDASGSPCPGDPEANAAWTIRKGNFWNGTVVASGFGGCPNWSGVEDVVVPASASPYFVVVDWYDSEGGYDEQTAFSGVYVKTAGEVVRLNY